MKKHELKFLTDRLGEILDNVARTPVDCGVKRRACMDLEKLIDLVKQNNLKEPPPPPEKPMDDFGFKFLKDLRLLASTPERLKELNRMIRHEEHLRRKARVQ